MSVVYSIPSKFVGVVFQQHQQIFEKPHILDAVKKSTVQ